MSTYAILVVFKCTDIAIALCISTGRLTIVDSSPEADGPGLIGCILSQFATECNARLRKIPTCCVKDVSAK